METRLLGTVLLITISGIMAQKDLQGKVFLFPRQTADSYMTLIPQMNKQLQAFTVCLWTYTELTRGYSVFSFATQASANEILLFREKVGQYSLAVGGEEVTFQALEAPLTPVNVCAIWESATGFAELWVNGKALVRKIMKKGYTLSANAKIIVGQDQDSYGGGFDADQSFVGEMGNVCMWDHVISPEEMKSSCCGNILSWKNLKYVGNGYAFIAPHFDSDSQFSQRM